MIISGIIKIFLKFLDEKKINKNDKINNPIDVLSPLNNTIINATTTANAIMKKCFLYKLKLDIK